MSSLPSRKRPHPPDQNAGGDAKNGSNVKVVVRIRPQNVKEVEGNFRVVVQAVDENILVFDPKENSGMDLGGRKGRRDIRKRQNRDLKFAFDRVFGPDAKNTDIYKETTNSVISGVLDGYNCSVFAYGATGAGKTYTMLGSKEQPGVMYHTMMDLYSHIDGMKDNQTCDVAVSYLEVRQIQVLFWKGLINMYHTMMDLYSHIDGMKDNQTCDVAVSYLEVYNETIRDLLMPGGPLPIREDPGKGVVIPGLSLHKPKNAEELLYMLQYGNQHRSQHPTDANAESSRSHAVFQVFVRQQDRTANISTEVRVAKMCLVDLAGSERATVTKNQGSRFREGANINRSLLALGNVINALAENKNKGFVPYRDSKLTRLLKDSLGGNCQTVMIAAVSPSAMSFEDTYNTLRYADRAKNIKATLKKNVLNVDFHMAKYGQIVTELRKEISELKSKLKNYEEGTISPVSVSVVPDMSSCVGFQSELDKFFMAHLAQRSDQVQQEISLRNLQWKLYRKRRCVARVKAINDEENQHRLESVVKGMSQKFSCLTISTDVSRGNLEQNMACFYDVENRWKGNVEGEHGQKMLDLNVHGHTTRLELQDAKQYLSFTKQVIRYQERELEHNERLVLQLLRLLRNQHFIMKGHNILTSDLEEEFKDILKKVRGQEVTWGDQQGDDELCRGTSLSEMLDLPTVKLKLTPGSNDVKRPQTKPDVSTVKNTAPKVWPSQPAAHNKPLPYTQVDECSPPKAKRIMLTHPSVQQPVRNDSEKLRQPQRNVSSIHRSHVMRSKRRRSYSESSHVRNRYTSKDVKFTSNISNNVPLRVLENNETDSSPDRDENQKSRFSKINDTITKAKKFSTLHTKSVNESKSDRLVKQSVSVKSDNLDSTFTVDDNENIPVRLPCIDTDGSVSKACVPSSCGQDNNGGRNTKHLHVSDGNLGVKSCNSEHTNSVQNTHTLPCNLVSPELNITHDIDPDRLESGVNDSNASTLVNQSSSSQTSVASTLVANLSQNLSNIEESENPSEQCSETHEESVESVIEKSEIQASICDIDEKVDGENVDTTNTKRTNGSINAPKLGDTVTKVHKRNCSSPNPGAANAQGNSVCINVGKLGATVTKVHKRDSSSPNPGVANTQQTSVSNNVPKMGATVTKVHKRDSSSPKPGVADSKQDKNTIKAARCIKFGDKRDSGGHTYVINGRKSGTPDRRPLYQLGDSNTPPILSDRSSFGSSSNSSDNDLSFDKALNKLRHSAAKLFDKENSKMSEGSLIINNSNKSKKSQSSTPGYMQATKAHNHRIKHNKSTKSEGEKLDNGPGRVRTSTSGNRPLQASMRSKSMSNLSSRSGWQI